MPGADDARQLLHRGGVREVEEPRGLLRNLEQREVEVLVLAHNLRLQRLLEVGAGVEDDFHGAAGGEVPVAIVIGELRRNHVSVRDDAALVVDHEAAAGAINRPVGEVQLSLDQHDRVLQQRVDLGAATGWNRPAGRHLLLI